MQHGHNDGYKHIHKYSDAFCSADYVIKDLNPKQSKLDYYVIKKDGNGNQKLKCTFNDINVDDEPNDNMLQLGTHHCLIGRFYKRIASIALIMSTVNIRFVRLHFYTVDSDDSLKGFSKSKLFRDIIAICSTF